MICGFAKRKMDFQSVFFPDGLEVHPTANYGNSFRIIPKWVTGCMPRKGNFSTSGLLVRLTAKSRG